MTKIYTLLFFLIAISTTEAQTVIYSENFDTDSTALPGGWTGTANGFIIETGNNSTGYAGATGLYNAAIRNLSATGAYEMISKNIPTTNYSSISILWASRVSNNFPNGGSAVQSLQWSSDNGATWNNLLYNENSNNSTWALTNGGVRIYLPSGASNKPNLKIKWIVNIVNAASGTYRIDDFDVQGTFNVGINDLTSSTSTIFYYDGMLNVKNTGEHSLNVFACNGKKVFENNSSNTSIYNLHELKKGLYIAQLIEGNKKSFLKFFVR